MTQKFLEELCSYFSSKRDMKYKSPIALDAYTYFKRGAIALFFYNDKDDIQVTIFLRDDPFFIENVYKHNITNIESYVSNTIIAKKLTLVDNDYIKYNTIVYAHVNDKFLFRLYDTDDFYIRNNIRVDYTDDNLNIIDNL